MKEPGWLRDQRINERDDQLNPRKPGTKKGKTFHSISKEADIRRGMTDCEKHGSGVGCTPDCPAIGTESECPEWLRGFSGSE